MKNLHELTLKREVENAPGIIELLNYAEKSLISGLDLLDSVIVDYLSHDYTKEQFFNFLIGLRDVMISDLDDIKKTLQKMKCLKD